MTNPTESNCHVFEVVMIVLKTNPLNFKETDFMTNYSKIYICVKQYYLKFFISMKEELNID